MCDVADILISVHAKYVDRFLAGTKKIELRRRRMNIRPGTRVWIYSTAPDARVCLCAVIEEVVISTPTSLWRVHREVMGVTR